MLRGIAPQYHLKITYNSIIYEIKLVPQTGFEPATPSLRRICGSRLFRLVVVLTSPIMGRLGSMPGRSHLQTSHPPAAFPMLLLLQASNAKSRVIQPVCRACVAHAAPVTPSGIIRQRQIRNGTFLRVMKLLVPFPVRSA